MNWVWWLVGGLGVAGVGLYVASQAGTQPPPQAQQPPQTTSPPTPAGDTGYITCMAAWPCADGSTQSGCSAQAACANHGGPATAGRIAIVERKSDLAWNQTEQTPISDTGYITCMAAWPCADGSTQSGCSAQAACANHGGPATAGRIAIAYDSDLAWNQTEQTPIWDRI